METVYIKGESDELRFQPYYVPKFDGDFSIAVYDKTHLGTNFRKCLCLNKVKGISIQAWCRVSETNPNVLRPSIIQVSEDGKILDQMKEKLARSMVSKEVENEMHMLGYKSEAEFCNVIREGLYVSDNTPGVSAMERCRKRLKLINWLDRGVNFGNFPPYGGTIKGLSHILYEGLRTSQEGKLYLQAIAKSGTYCVRAPNTLCSESFFGSMQEIDQWGQGILSTSGVENISDFTTVTAMKLEDNRNSWCITESCDLSQSNVCIQGLMHMLKESTQMEIEIHHMRSTGNLKVIKYSANDPSTVFFLPSSWMVVSSKMYSLDLLCSNVASIYFLKNLSESTQKQFVLRIDIRLHQPLCK